MSVQRVTMVYRRAAVNTYVTTLTVPFIVNATLASNYRPILEDVLVRATHVYLVDRTRQDKMFKLLITSVIVNG